MRCFQVLRPERITEEPTEVKKIIWLPGKCMFMKYSIVNKNSVLHVNWAWGGVVVQAPRY